MSSPCKQIGRTTDEWLESLKEELCAGLSEIHDTEDPVVIEAKYQELIRDFPKSEPYVL